MGMRTHISGFIFADAKHDSQNDHAIRNYPYDDVYPLRPIFSLPVPGYEGSMISFATSIKANPDEWPEWLSAFEKFLANLSFESAQVTFQGAEQGETVTYEYLVTEYGEDKVGASRWKSIHTPGQEKCIEFQRR